MWHPGHDRQAPQVLNAFLAALVAAAAAFGFAGAVSRFRHVTDPAELHWSHAVPVLGGNQPSSHAWGRFHARYYPMTIVLVAFEMEMMFMYPWAVVYREMGIKALAEMGVFLVILGLGILYAWREGAFRWQ